VKSKTFITINLPFVWQYHSKYSGKPKMFTNIIYFVGEDEKEVQLRCSLYPELK